MMRITRGVVLWLGAWCLAQEFVSGQGPLPTLPLPAMPNLRPMNGLPGQSWHPIWERLYENRGELLRAMSLPSFSAESMVSLTEGEGGKVYLDYATFDEKSSVRYLLRGQLPEGTKRRTIDQFVPKRVNKPFPTELAWQLNHLWGMALLKVAHPETPSWTTDGEQFVFSAFVYARGTLSGMADNDMPESHPLVQATRLLLNYANATNPEVEARTITTLGEVVATGSIAIRSQQKETASSPFFPLFLEWKQIMAKATETGRSILIFADVEQRLKLGKLAAGETRFLSTQLYEDCRVLNILYESPELMNYAKEVGVAVTPGSLSDEDRSRWLKLLREWEVYLANSGR